ncbi:MAG: DUF4432 family protein [Candidatus Nanopelagicaceae bacterium]|nr:DUF4432 family protein [Candidatus Nanopelagicaceae bacterium]
MLSSLTLANGDLEIVVLPECGGAISEATFKGIQFMARPPKPAQSPVNLGNEADWVRAWNGGWQPLLPNAGGEYKEGRYPQGFHGNASQTPWIIEQVSQDEVVLSWVGEELRSTRTINVANDKITLGGTLANLGDLPREFILTEHVVFGDSLLTADAKLQLNGQARFMELGYDGAMIGEIFEPWHEVAWSDWSVVTKSTPARLGLVTDVDSSGVSIVGENLTATLSWDTENLPYAWIWEEMGATKADPWNGEYFCLGIEPSTAPQGAGLGESIRTGTTTTLEPQAIFHWWVALKLASASTEE